MEGHCEQVDFGGFYLRTRAQDSDTLVVCFENGGGRYRRADAPRFAFGEHLCAHAGLDSLHVMPKRMDWYQAPALRASLQRLRDSGFFTPYRRVVNFGSSMGGFGALAFGSLTGADQVVALQPRTTLFDSQLGWDSKFSRRHPVARRGRFADALRGLSPPCAVLVFADPLFSRDWRHARRVQQAQVIRVPGVKHAVPAFLAGIKQFRPHMIAAFHARFDPKQFYRDIRARRDSAQYQRYMRQHIAARGL